MSKREEIKEILSSIDIEVEETVFLKLNDIILDNELNELTDKFLALTECKCERVREYCEKWGNQSTSNTIKLICTEILSILNENEKPFDLMEYLESKGLYNQKGQGVFRTNEITIYVSDGDKLFSIKRFDTMLVNECKWTSRYFFETLVKALGIELRTDKF